MTDWLTEWLTLWPILRNKCHTTIWQWVTYWIHLRTTQRLEFGRRSTADNRARAWENSTGEKEFPTECLILFSGGKYMQETSRGIYADGFHVTRRRRRITSNDIHDDDAMVQRRRPRWRERSCNHATNQSVCNEPQNVKLPTNINPITPQTHDSRGGCVRRPEKGRRRRRVRRRWRRS